MRNEALANRDESLGSLNRTMNSFATTNVKALQQISKEIGNLTKNLSLQQKVGKTKRDFVRREDPTTKLIKEVDDLEELMKQNNKLQKGKGKGSLSELISGLFELGGLVGYFLTGKKKMLFSAIKGLMKYSPIKMFKSIGEGVMMLFKPLAKIFGKGGAKIGAKGASKSFLKRIPVLGGLLGLFFGIQRFKQGDWLGGTLEVVSGISSIVPGIGTALGIAIDSFLLVRDFKGIEQTDAALGRGIKKIAPTVLRNIPGIGTFIRFKEGFDMWETDKIGALKLFGSGMASVIPNGGMFFDTVISLVENLNVGEKLKGVATKVKDFASSFKENPIKATKNLVSGTISGAKNIGTGLVNTVEETVGNIQYQADNIKTTVDNAVKNVTDPIYGFIENGRGFPFSMVKNSSDVNINDLKPGIKKKLFSLAADYYNATGKKLVVTSGYRSKDKQQKLYDAYLKGQTDYIVAEPGSSKHNFGEAVDVWSKQANWASEKGLLSKHGLKQPFPSSDPVHLVEQGDGSDNLPNNRIQSKRKDSMNTVKLDNDTVNKIVSGIVEGNKSLKPKSNRVIQSYDTSMRG